MSSTQGARKFPANISVGSTSVTPTYWSQVAPPDSSAPSGSVTISGTVNTVNASSTATISGVNTYNPPQPLYYTAGSNVVLNPSSKYPTGGSASLSGTYLDMQNVPLQIQSVSGVTLYGILMRRLGLSTLMGDNVNTSNGAVGTTNGLDGYGFMNKPTGVAVDLSGNIIIADTDNHAIRILPKQNGTYYGVSCSGNSLNTIAGTIGISGLVEGPVGVGRLRSPQGVAVTPSGLVLIADTGNHTIRGITNDSGLFPPMSAALTAIGVPGSTISGFSLLNLMGSSTGISGTGGTVINGGACLRSPASVVMDAAGNILVADTGNHRFRVLFAANISGVDNVPKYAAGSSVSGGWSYLFLGGTNASGYVEHFTTSARFSSPAGIGLDPSGNVIVADTGNNLIRCMPLLHPRNIYGTPTNVSGAFHTITIGGTAAAGIGVSGATNGIVGTGRLWGPRSVSIDLSGNIVVADTNNHTLRVIPRVPGTYYGQTVSVSGSMFTIAGIPGAPTGIYQPNGLATTTNLYSPSSSAVDMSGNIILAEPIINRIRCIYVGPDVIPTYTVTLPFAAPETATLNFGTYNIGYFGTTIPSTTFTLTSANPIYFTPGTRMTWSGATASYTDVVTATNVSTNLLLRSGNTLSYSGYVFNNGNENSGAGSWTNMGTLNFSNPIWIMTSGGTRYVVGNNFRIDGSFFGGKAPANDIIISVTGVNSYGAVTSFIVDGTMPASPIYKPIILDFVDYANYVREASEWTSSTREVKVYNEKRADSNINGDGKVEVQQGNQFRLSYLFGNLKTGAAFGGAFNLNGPRSRS